MPPAAPPSPPVPIGVGIDSARYGHHVTFLRPDLQPAADPLTVTESAEGYRHLADVFDRLRRRYPNAHFHIRIDAAGPYAINLETFLRALPLPKTLSIGHPLRNRRYREVHFPQQKTDPAESYSVGRFALVERPRPTPPIPRAIRELREIAGRLEGQTRRTTRCINQLHNLMARVFPELALVARDFRAGWVLGLLQRYPTPAKIARARALARLPYLTPERARQIQAHATDTVGTLTGPIAEALVTELVAQVRQARGTERRLQRLLVKAYDALPQLPPIRSIPGIGPLSAAALVAKIVSIDRFDTPDQLVAYFGVFPQQARSGVDKTGRPKPGIRMRMSAHGNDLVRKYLWMAAGAAIRSNPAGRALYQRKRAEGKSGGVARGHVMRKLLHLVFAIWKTRRPFDPDHYPWESSPAGPKDEAAGHKEDAPRQRSVVTAASACRLPRPAEPVNPSAAPPTDRPGRIDFARLRRQVSLEQVLRHIGHLDRLSGSGPQRRGPCPLHDRPGANGRTFSVHLDNNIFRCFASECNAAGNVLDFWAALQGLPLRDAAVHLAATFQIPIGTVKRNPSIAPVASDSVGGPKP